MGEQYIALEVTDWLDRLQAELPAFAARSNGERVIRERVIEEISEHFDVYMSTGPNYSRSVTGHIQAAARRFSEGNGDQVDAELNRAHKILVAMDEAVR